MGGFEGQKEDFVLDMELPRQPLEKYKEWRHVVRMARGVNDFSSRTVYRNEEV